MTAEDVLRWAHEEFGMRVCLTCSWQKQSSVLLHMVSELGLPIDVVELDTHLFFRESYETRDRLVERYGVDARSSPRSSRSPSSTSAKGRTCGSATPTAAATSARSSRWSRRSTPYDAWISGIRRDQSPSRIGTREARMVERYDVWKIHPLADWDEKRVWAYIAVNEIPYNPLHDVGLPVDRVHSLHAADQPRRGGTGRPLGRLRQT